MKANIVIASTLKPVIDPRNYEKIGKSLAQTNKYHVHIIGSYPDKKLNSQNITLYPIAINTKSTLSRLLLPWKVLSQVQKNKPALLIIGTHELLFIGVLYKLFIRGKLIYDVRENYFRNLIYQKNYPWLFKQILALYVRTKEYVISPFIDQFILAEACYADELNFIGKRFTIIENKFKTPEKWTKNIDQNKTELLLSGTISKEYGSLDAIRFFKSLPAGAYKLLVVGHCPNKKTYLQLMRLVEDDDNIEFQVSSTPISQDNILSRIGNKTIGLLPYQDNKSTRNKVPTKLYEYIGLGIPTLISPNQPWEKLLIKHSMGISFDFIKGDSIEFNSRINNLTTSTYNLDLKDVIWKSEEIKLLPLINKLIYPN